MSPYTRKHGRVLIRLAVSSSHSEGTLQGCTNSTRGGTRGSTRDSTRPHTLVYEAGILLAPILASGPTSGRNGLSRSGTQCNIQIQGAVMPLHCVDRRLILPFQYTSDSWTTTHKSDFSHTHLRLLEHPDISTNERVVRISEDAYVLEIPRYGWGREEETRAFGQVAAPQ